MFLIVFTVFFFFFFFWFFDIVCYVIINHPSKTKKTHNQNTERSDPMKDVPMTVYRAEERIGQNEFLNK